MTKKEYALFYDRCSSTELEQFIISRGLKASGMKGMSYEDAIKTLQDADLAATFRFLDLPAEMRNIVYSEALSLSGQPYLDLFEPQRCTSQILVTCKQVNREAGNLLYEGSCVSLHIRLNGGEEHARPNELQVILNGRRVATSAKPSFMKKETKPSFMTMDWPAYLNRIQSLELNLYLLGFLSSTSIDESRARRAEVNHPLNSLYSFLACKSDIRELHVDLVGLLTANNNLQKPILYPLCALSAGIAKTTFCFGVQSSSPTASGLRPKHHRSSAHYL